MLRQALLALSESTKIKNVVTRAPLTRDVVARFVAGVGVDDAVAATSRLVAVGLAATALRLTGWRLPISSCSLGCTLPI
jgi:proline dehydrogenase